MDPFLNAQVEDAFTIKSKGRGGEEKKKKEVVAAWLETKIHFPLCCGTEVTGSHKATTSCDVKPNGQLRCTFPSELL